MSANHDSCAGCIYDLGGGCCRINLEDECREGGGFEAWTDEKPVEVVDGHIVMWVPYLDSAMVPSAEGHKARRETKIERFATFAVLFCICCSALSCVIVLIRLLRGKPF